MWSIGTVSSRIIAPLMTSPWRQNHVDLRPTNREAAPAEIGTILVVSSAEDALEGTSTHRTSRT
jgi:hypothetical protein